MNGISLEACLEAASDTKALLVEQGAIAKIPRLLKNYFELEASPVFLIADENTWKAAGEECGHVLTDARVAQTEPFIFPAAGLHGEYGLVEKLKTLMKEQSEKNGLVPLAVGSGTINDIVKCAAGERGLPYCCVPTAASVDGYTAHGAALLRDGFKQTLPCAAPRLVVADTDVLSRAPAYLSSSGYGDLAGKLAAGADWIIADTIYKIDPAVPGLMPINERAWAMVQTPLRPELERAAGAARGDREALRVLFEALGITGFALQYMKDSRPVSGCEHMWAHVWEMENLQHNGQTVTHGHKVAIGSLAAAAFFECLFSKRPDRAESPPSKAEREAQIEKAFAGDPGACAAAKKTALSKLLDVKQQKRLTEGVRDSWDDLKDAVKKQLPPYAELCAMFVRAGCPVKPEDAGLSKRRIIQSARKAQMIRVRYSVLDLAFDLGVFNAVLSRLEEDSWFV
ncbi:MAG: iron-containing alcohol dehydrogenase [Treponema sp.]|jgi:glycerol-1-phosphate dehydrogenase [NAD(P)+]|nr:iron-containing alcohol dehydrogenase [Treponema sp.]